MMQTFPKGTLSTKLSAHIVGTKAWILLFCDKTCVNEHMNWKKKFNYYCNMYLAIKQHNVECFEKLSCFGCSPPNPDYSDFNFPVESFLRKCC